MTGQAFVPETIKLNVSNALETFANSIAGVLSVKEVVYPDNLTWAAGCTNYGCQCVTRETCCAYGCFVK